jgi:hypothetical protein
MSSAESTYVAGVSPDLRVDERVLETPGCGRRVGRAPSTTSATCRN